MEYLSVLGVLGDAVGGVRRGLPEEWRQQVNRLVDDAGARAARSLWAPGGSILPSFITPSPSRGDTPFAESLAVIRDADPAELSLDLIRDFEEDVPAGWRAAMDRPRDWIAAYGAAVAATDQVTSNLWHQATPLLDRETERIGLAMVRDRRDEVLANLSPRIKLVNGSLRFRHASGGRYELGGRTIILTPMVSGDRMLFADFDHSDYVWFGYPLPGSGNIRRGAPPVSVADPLEILLGPVRAALLRQLRQPATMGQLAAALGLSPSKVSGHCDRLESAHLIRRERRGRTVRVTRTTHGSGLIDLYQN